MNPTWRKSKKQNGTQETTECKRNGDYLLDISLAFPTTKKPTCSSEVNSLDKSERENNFVYRDTLELQSS